MQRRYLVTPVIAGLWNAAFELFGKIRREEQDTDWLEPWFHYFALEGHAPKAGEIWNWGYGGDAEKDCRNRRP